MYRTCPFCWCACWFNYCKFCTKTYDILDTKWYDNPTSTGVSKYTANSGVSISYDSTNEAYFIQKNNGSGLSSVTLNNYRFPNTVTVKADIMLSGVSTNHQTGIGLLNNNTAINGKVCYYSPDSYYAVSLIESTRTTYGTNEVVSTDTHLNIQKNKWYTLIVEYNGNNQTASLYDGDTLIGSVSATKSVLDSSSNEFAMWNGFNSSGK